MMLAEPYLWAAVLAVGWLLLVGWPVATDTDRELSVVGVGFLRRGERGAIGTAATVLFAEGLVQLTRHGALARSAVPMRAGVDTFAAAVYAAMPVPTGLRALSAKPRVRTAVAVLVRELAAMGLVPGRVRWAVARVALIAIAATAVYGLASPDRLPVERMGYASLLLVGVGAWLVPRRTAAGYRTLRRLRREHARLDRPPAGIRPVPKSDAATAYALRGVTTPAMDAAHEARSPHRGAGGGGDSSDAGPDLSPWF